MKRKNTILITGGSGMIGSQVPFGIKPSKKELDILDPVSIQKAIEKYKPNIILHLAAMTDMLGAEENPKYAHQINVKGTQYMARACKKYNVKLIYMSTCVVFPGNKKTPYTENDKTSAKNVYGQTKLDGEKITQKLLKAYLIIRTGWLFGGGKNDKKFVRTMYSKLKVGEDLKAIDDRYGSPTYIKDLLSSVHKLIEKDKSGIYHVVNSGTASYFDVGKEIKRIGKFKSKVMGVKSKDIDNKKLKRDKMEALTSKKMELRSWKRALKEYLS